MSANARAKTFADTQRLGSKTDTDKIEVLEFTCKIREDSEATPKPNRSLARVYNADPLDVARECATAGYNAAMLVEINENHPIPGMLKGGMQGQESEVLLRSNYGRRMNDSCYPLKRRYLTYAAGIMVHKDKVYELYQKSFSVALIGSTIVRRPTLHSKQEDGISVQCYANRSEEELMRDTINSVFHLARTKGYDTLVLPALGCEQGHPIDAVIKFFNEAMARFNIKYVFYAVKSYTDYKPRCQMFMAYHHAIERKYVPSSRPVAKPKAPAKVAVKAVSKIEEEIREDADAELEADTLGTTDDDMAWLEDLGTTVAEALDPVEPTVVETKVRFEEPPKRKTTKTKKKTTK